MNTISTQSSMVRMATDGQALYSSAAQAANNNAIAKQASVPITPTGAQVAQNIQHTPHE